MKYIREHKNAVWPRVISSYEPMKRHGGVRGSQIKKKKSFWQV